MGLITHSAVTLKSNCNSWQNSALLCKLLKYFLNLFQIAPLSGASSQFVLPWTEIYFAAVES